MGTVFRADVLCFIILAFMTCAESQRRAGCTDLQPWCESNSAYCGLLEVMSTMCAKTCDLCKPPECQECKHNCSEIAEGEYECTCYRGYKLGADGKSCDDIDECAEKDTCKSNETCTNSKGGYTCGGICGTFDDHTNYYERPYDCCKITEGSCGKNIQNGGRILGGDNATFGQWPWQAYILLGSQLCGGTLINSRWVVSAAHCFDSVTDLDKQEIDVRLGVHSSKDQQASHIEVRRIVEVIKYESFSFPLHDIALVRLNASVDESDTVRPACMPNGETPTVGTKCYATGFGLTQEFGDQANILQEVAVPIVDREECKKVYDGIHDVDTVRMICAGEPGKDACQGDSGGPLVCQRCNSCDWYLAGVTSFGEGCGRKEYYGVYTDVEFYEEWIESKVNGISITKKACVPTSWARWGRWGPCSESCGGGTQSRTRNCRNGEPNSPGCTGEQLQIRNCNERDCTGDSWTQWTSCSATCGSGTQSRDRICITRQCEDTTERRACKIRDCPAWTMWTDWSGCDPTCGNGRRTRTRECTNGEKGEPGCRGNSAQRQDCNSGPCASWGSWGGWSGCTVSCGDGTQESSRECRHGIAGTDCEGSASKMRACNNGECVGEFDPWSGWTRCSHECGGGEQSRDRICPTANCAPDEFGTRTLQTRTCNNEACPEWTRWSSWGRCSASCGGTRSRTRVCLQERLFSDFCPGVDSEKEDCSECATGVCSDVCLLGVQSGYCVSFDPSILQWMRGFCHHACCTEQFCKDTFDQCAEYGLAYCGNPNFSAVCSRFCGKCPP